MTPTPYRGWILRIFFKLNLILWSDHHRNDQSKKGEECKCCVKCSTSVKVFINTSLVDFESTDVDPKLLLNCVSDHTFLVFSLESFAFIGQNNLSTACRLILPHSWTVSRSTVTLALLNTFGERIFEVKFKFLDWLNRLFWNVFTWSVADSQFHPFSFIIFIICAFDAIVHFKLDFVVFRFFHVIFAIDLVFAFLVCTAKSKSPKSNNRFILS